MTTTTQEKQVWSVLYSSFCWDAYPWLPDLYHDEQAARSAARDLADEAATDMNLPVSEDEDGNLLIGDPEDPPVVVYIKPLSVR